MNIALQRRIDQRLGPLLCWLLSCWTRWQRRPEPAGQPERILVILLSEMGSLVLAQPMLTRLQQKYPAATLYALVFQANKEVLELLQIIPEAQVLSLRPSTFSTLCLDSWRAVRTLRRWRIDTVLDCELFARFSSLFAVLSGATRRVGFHPHTQEGLYRGDFITHPVLYNPYHHIAQQFLTLVEAIDGTDMPLVKRRIPQTPLRIQPMDMRKEEVAAFVSRLTADFPQLDGKRLVLIYAGGGLLPIRAWPLPSFCQVATDLIGQGYIVGVIGLRQDHSLAQVMQAACGTAACLDLTGYTRTLRELLLLFQRAALLLTNDGGPAHFAALTPLPALIFYGPETPLLYGSLEVQSVNLHTPLACSPCLTAYNHRHSPCNGHNVCLTSITPAQVLAQAYAILDPS
ncbi:MAG: glycosyltransferase family 9 protein [Candidatus Tectimicrobiota bacterium]